MLFEIEIWTDILLGNIRENDSARPSASFILSLLVLYLAPTLTSPSLTHARFHGDRGAAEATQLTARARPPLPSAFTKGFSKKYEAYSTVRLKRYKVRAKEREDVRRRRRRLRHRHRPHSRHLPQAQHRLGVYTCCAPARVAWRAV